MKVSFHFYSNNSTLNDNISHISNLNSILDALTFAKQLCDEYNLTDEERKREIQKRESEEKRNIESFKLLKTELISIMKDKKISWSRKRHCFDLLSRCLVRIDLDLTQVILFFTFIRDFFLLRTLPLKYFLG